MPASKRRSAVRVNHPMVVVGPDPSGCHSRVAGRLGIGPVRGHIGGMATFDKCMSILRPLLTEADTNGIGAAERAVNEYVAATAPQNRKAALLNIQQAVRAHRDEASGVHLSFADTVNDYIEKLMRGFE